MTVEAVGAICFGLVVGWTTYRTLRRRGGTAGLSDIAGVIGAVGGAAITGLFPDKQIFSYYCVGLAAGFFLYLLLGTFVPAFRDNAWLGGD